MHNPHVADNDKGEITVSLHGAELRGWSYKDDAERRTKMQMAHEFAEGIFVAKKRIKNSVDFLLNEHLCCMGPNCDDSITGFNEAWDLVRKILADEPK
jgi:hypothetical protein